MSAPDRIGLIQGDFLDGMWALASADEADVSVHYLRATPAREAAPDLLAALEEILGVGFDAPMTWGGTDAEWERRRANIMQGIARAAIAKARGDQA